MIRLSAAQANDAGNGKTYSAEGNGLVMHQYKCNECTHVFDEIIDRKEGGRHTDPQECPKCRAVDSR